MAKSLPERLAAQIFAKLDPTYSGPSPAIKTAIGRREIPGHKGHPRVIAIPLGAPVIRQPDRPGDAKYDDAGRILLVREFNIEWRCHAAVVAGDPAGTSDFGKAEALLSALVVAIRTIAHHSVVFSEERWLDQEENSDGYEKHGCAISVMSTISIPLYEARSPIVGLTATPQIETHVVLNEDEANAVTINQGEDP